MVSNLKIAEGGGEAEGQGRKIFILCCDLLLMPPN